ncbi:MAG: energy-coupling factor ABC transporter permease [Desulfobacterales bacterium]|nr:energy-coupling factor ABC transporter permease [Desulfobacterales bacterium]
MSHIHIQDGILPLWLVLIGLLFVLGYIIFLPFYLKKHAVNKKLAIVGVMAAIMLISMSVEIIPPAYHMNLAILAGIILGPVLSVMSILVTNVLLAFLGHGGVSVIGLNTLVVSFEAILGFFGFKILKSRIKNVFLSAFIASFIALLLRRGLLSA